MKKFTRDEYIKRTDELERVLFKDLPLRNVLNDEELNNFFIVMISYLEHSSTNELAGRTPETLENNIKRFLDFARKVGLNDREIISVIEKDVSILHRPELEEKYLLLGLIEDDNNSLRKYNLLNQPESYRVSLKTLYARYCLATSLNFKLTWSSLVEDTEVYFAKKFTKTKYFKPYKIFNSIEECSTENLWNMYPIDYNFIEELRELEINSCLKDKEKING